MKWYNIFGDDMRKYPFQITNEILKKVVEISQLVGQVNFVQSLLESMIQRVMICIS